MKMASKQGVLGLLKGAGEVEDGEGAEERKNEERCEWGFEEAEEERNYLSLYRIGQDKKE